MRFFGIFFAFLCIFSLWETWILGEAATLNKGGIKKDLPGHFEPTQIFGPNSKSGRLETIQCPEGQFLSPSRFCLKPEDFMPTTTKPPKRNEPVAQIVPKLERDLMPKFGCEVSNLKPKIKNCERWEVYSVKEGKCVRRPFMQTIG